MPFRTTQEQIDIANASCIYASNELAGGHLHGGSMNERWPSLIYAVRQGLEWLYELDPTHPDLENFGNYLISICKWWDRAEANIIGGGGGTIINQSGNLSLINDIDWKVGATAYGLAPLADGESYVALDGTNGMPDLRGYKINFFRGGVTQNTTPLGDGSTYYYWNRITGLLQLLGAAPANGAAQSGELMRISPDVYGSGTVTNANEPQTIFMDADGTYTLAEGYMIWKILIKPTAADAVKIGTTLGGDEIMFEKIMTPNVYTGNGVGLVDDSAMADGAPMTIYFTGFTSQAQIDIYILPLP